MPSEPLELNFTTGAILEGYYSLFSALGIQNANTSINISRTDYPDGYTLFAFDLTGGDPFSREIKTGNIRIEARFKDATTETITAITLGRYPDYFQLDSYRNVIKSK